MSKPNRHGLKRHIPSKVSEKIRRDAGFGCIVCGDLVVEYEHIEPSFADAIEHDPEKMTLLCPKHHSRVTKGLISKKQIWKYKENPKM